MFDRRVTDHWLKPTRRIKRRASCERTSRAAMATWSCRLHSDCVEPDTPERKGARFRAIIPGKPRLAGGGKFRVDPQIAREVHGRGGHDEAEQKSQLRTTFCHDELHEFEHINWNRSRC